MTISEVIDVELHNIAATRLELLVPTALERERS